MSTLGKNVTHQRFALLARMGESIFHADDLANMWGIANANTLHTTLARYVRAGLLQRVYRGLYALDNPMKVDGLLLGAKVLHRFCYVTTETVLAQTGVITQYLDAITFVSDVSRQFSVAGRRYRSRQLADNFLYNDIGIERRRNGVRVASVERAVADMLYFAPAYHIDDVHGIEWDRVSAISHAIGYPTLTRKV